MNSSYNRPEIWEDQLGNFATGGSLYARTPSTELQLLSFDMPSFDAGCGGININFGGFGYISGDQIQSLIKQIGTNALSYTVMLTIKSISPQIADLLENLVYRPAIINAWNCKQEHFLSRNKCGAPRSVCKLVDERSTSKVLPSTLSIESWAQCSNAFRVKRRQKCCRP